VTVWDEVDEELLMPGEASQIVGKRAPDLRGTGAQAAKPAAAKKAKGKAASKPQQNQVPKGGGSKRDERRAEAEQRNERHRSTKELRAELRKVEKDWEKAENRLAELHATLADPAIYDDTERVTALSKEYDETKDQAADLSGRWEALASKIERVG
jgi:ATP-binding cassette subfamily F protein 3